MPPSWYYHSPPPSPYASRNSPPASSSQPDWPPYRRSWTGSGTCFCAGGTCGRCLSAMSRSCGRSRRGGGGCWGIRLGRRERVAAGWWVIAVWTGGLCGTACPRPWRLLGSCFLLCDGSGRSILVRSKSVWGSLIRQLCRSSINWFGWQTKGASILSHLTISSNMIWISSGKSATHWHSRPSYQPTPNGKT